MVRAPCFDSNGMKKGAWSEEEDNKLRAFVEINGHLNWRLVPKYAGLARCGKSCRLRWMNYLKPGVRRGNFSKQEEDLIIKLHAQLGNKWSVIATKLPGRTDNDIKNYYHSRIEKRRGQNRAAKKVIVHASDASSKLDDQVMEEEKASALTLSCKTTQNEIASSDANSLITLQQSTLLFDANPSILPITKPQVNLWPDRLLADTNCNQNDYFPTLTFEDELFNPVLHYSKLSSSDDSSYQLSGFDWTADDDQVLVEGSSNFRSESLALDTSIFQSDSTYIPPPPQEVGGLYDSLIHYFDYE